MGRICAFPICRGGQTIGGYLLGAASWVILAFMLFLSTNAFAASEQRFDVLQIGTRTYQNVKVTTKAKSYIFILHSGGMTNIKVSELPNDILQKLGYITAPIVQTNGAALWARQAAAKMDTPQLKQLEAKLLQSWRGARAVIKSHLPPLKPGVIVVAAGVLIMAYLFHCYCCMLICQKTGNEPGVLVWLPVLQVLPMLRAASMSAWWFVTWFIPGLNLVGHAVWCGRIVQARNKTIPLLVLLLVPVMNIFAFLYLAFSEAAPQKKEEPHVEIMTLETA
jgi:hypothetical protein